MSIILRQLKIFEAVARYPGFTRASEQLVVLDVKAFPILLNWYIVQRPDKRLSGVVLEFKSFVLEESQQILQLPTLPRPVAQGGTQSSRKKWGSSDK